MKAIFNLNNTTALKNAAAPCVIDDKQNKIQLNHLDLHQLKPDDKGDILSRDISSGYMLRPKAAVLKLDMAVDP